MQFEIQAAINTGLKICSFIGKTLPPLAVTLRSSHILKNYIFRWSEPEFFMYVSQPTWFNFWFSFAPVFQWCCLTSQRSLGISLLFLNSPHLCFVIGFSCGLFVARNNSWMN